MLISVSDDLSLLTVSAEKQEQESILGSSIGQNYPIEVCQFANPVLLTDPARIGEMEPGLRDAVHALYASYPRTVRYDGVEVSWSPQRHPRVWCPNIDTVFLARSLRPLLREARSVAEVGTGSGFLTKFMMTHAPHVRRVVASDINLDALRCASDAIAEGLTGSISLMCRVSMVCPQADDPALGIAGKFDVIVCNPPYIPRPGMRNDNPYEGLDLIRKLSDQAGDLLEDDGVMLLNISSLSGPEPERWLREAGWQVELGPTMDVPLKVNAVTNGLTEESREWMAYLADRGALMPQGSDEHPRDGYRFWHTLRILACRRA